MVFRNFVFLIKGDIKKFECFCFVIKLLFIRNVYVLNYVIMNWIINCRW